MKCSICNHKSNFLTSIEGYIEGSSYDIFSCANCGCHHMDLSRIEKDSYDKIYSAGDSILGYDRYRGFARQIVKESNPLLWLAKQEDTYLPVWNFLKDKRNLNILEIGCGLGYLTHAIQSSGNSCIGIDLSKEAIINAKKMFPDSDYFSGDAFSDESVLKGKKFDVIIATELIEHIDNYNQFFSKSHEYLNTGGTVIITTPNKGFYRDDAIRIGDLPPVHTTRFSCKTFENVGKNYGFNVSFFDYVLKSNSSNLLIYKLYNNIILKLKLSKPHQISYTQEIKEQENIIVHLLNKLFTFPVIKHISNYLCYLLFGNNGGHLTLGVYLTKK